MLPLARAASGPPKCGRRRPPNAACENVTLATDWSRYVEPRPVTRQDGADWEMQNQGQPEIWGRSVVLVGRFNPSIFHPQWFARVDLLPKEEADNAELHIGSPDIIGFGTDWFNCQVTLDRFQVSTLRSDMEEPLRDLVVGTLQVLTHVPITACGLNVDAHRSTRTEQQWHALGHTLTPKSFWSEHLRDPGMRSLVIQGRRPAGTGGGAIVVKVEPSVRVDPGIYVQWNDHFDLTVSEETTWAESTRAGPTSPEDWIGSAPRIIEIIEREWDRSRDTAMKLIDAVMRLGKEGAAS